MSTPRSFDFEAVRELLPQQYPILMIDRVLDVDPGKRITCLKNVTGSEPWLQGHFPDFAVMPGALILEALAQASILLFRCGEATENKPDPNTIYLFGSVRAKMKHVVRPGDALHLSVEPLTMMGDGGAVRGTASVDERICVEAELYFSKVQADQLRSGTTH